MTVEAIGAAEVARVLGVSRRRLGELVVAGDAFPVPAVGAGGCGVWEREEVEAWAASHPDLGPAYAAPQLPVREPRVCHGERMTREMRKLFELAFEQAVELNHYALGPSNLVLGMLHPECPGVAREVLESFGLGFDSVREAWAEWLGDPYEPHEGGLVVPPGTVYMLERAKLQALDMRDEYVSSEHLLLDMLERADRVLGDRELAAQLVDPIWMQDNLLWLLLLREGPPPALRLLLAPEVIDSGAVRERTVARTEDPTMSLAPAPTMATPRFGELELRWTGDRPELAPSPLGHHPERRRPWGSGTFSRADGKPGEFRQGKQSLQFRIDRDGYPVLSTDGRPVHLLIDENGHHVLDGRGRPQHTVLDPPPESKTQAYPRADRA